jgi:hypothetical protein
LKAVNPGDIIKERCDTWLNIKLQERKKENITLGWRNLGNGKHY